MKLIVRLALALLASVALNSHAITLSLEPAQSQITLGNELRLDIKIQDLNNNIAPALGAYDFNLDFKSDLLSVTTVQWGGSLLGNQLDQSGFGSLQDIISSALNAQYQRLNLFELSFDSADHLEAQQAGSFTLLSIFFATHHIGIADFGLSINVLSDAYGNSLIADVITTYVNINNGSAINVPEPSSLWLLLGGLLLCSRSIPKWRN